MSKAKNFRKRAEGDGDGEAQEEDGGKLLLNAKNQSSARKSGKPQLLSFAEEEDEEKSVARKKTDAHKGKPPRKNSLLSFGDEGNASEQKSKKKAGYGISHGSGHKLGSSKEKTHSVSNVLPQAGEYTPERLQELHRNTVRLGRPPPPAPAEPKNEPVVILKGQIKPVSESEDNNAVPEVLPEVPEALPEMSLEDGGGIEQIPDAAAIAAAKAQRERKRKAQSAPDYIPLTTGNSDFRSRLREAPDDIPRNKEEPVSSDDEAEVRGRLTFIGDKTNGSNKGGVFEFVENTEEEDEDKIWEEEQLKKGVGKRVDDASTLVPALPSGYSAIPSGYSQNVSSLTEPLSIPQQAESVMMALQHGLKRLQDTHARTKSELYTVEQNISSSNASLIELEESISSASKKFYFMQQVQDYISTLCDFLQEKSPLIEALEEHMQQLHEKRASVVLQRRIMDNTDEKLEIEAAVGAATAVLSKGGPMQKATAQAISAATAAAMANDSGPQLDEFGRDLNLQKRQEKKLRAEKRRRRMARKINEEYSSDESDSEEKAFNEERDMVLDTAGRIFSDSAEEYSQLHMIKDRLESWNREYPAAYRDAYVSLSAPAIFAPFVRLELLKWDPLHEATSFHNMKWHSLLCEYDEELIPNLVEKVALPLLHHDLKHCWDRLSTRRTSNAVAAVLDILIYLEASSKGVQDLIALIRTQLALAVSEMEVPTWSSQVTTAVAQAAQLAAYRFESSVKLLNNIGLWKTVLPRSVLDQLALDELLNARILPHLRVLSPQDSVTRAQRVVSALRGAWIGKDVPELSPKLGAFVSHLIGIGRSLEKRRDLADMSLVRSVRNMLIDLNEYDRARELGKQFKLDDGTA